MRLPALVVAALVVGGAATAGGYAAVAADEGAATEVLGPGTETVTITIEESRFRPARIRVHEGTQVRFVVRNTDPIAHELIVGDAEVQDRHERGTEAHHGAVPGEVSVAPGEEATTTYTFDRAGEVLYGCHLPGHWGYGMRGVVQVRA